MSPAVRTTGPKGLRDQIPGRTGGVGYAPRNGPQPAGTDADVGACQRIAGGEATTATWGLRATASWRPLTRAGRAGSNTVAYGSGGTTQFR
jgi:hypothetical protein